MQFVHPIFLLVAIALGLALTLLTVRVALARRRALVLLGSRHLLGDLTASVSRARRRLKEAMLVVGVMLVAVALARPQRGFTWQETHRRGADLLFAVDTSRSMLTRDVAPNRLERAKLAVKDLVGKFPGDRVGLVAFAGKAFLETPLTLDHAIFEESLDALDTDTVPLGGTDVASAIALASKTLAADDHEKVLVLLTDGEELSGNALRAAEQAAKTGLVVHTVGVGTPRGELIPLPGAKGETRFVKDDEGRLVTSHLDQTRLQQIAAATHGTYHALGDSGRGLAALYEETLANLPTSELASRTQKVPIERFQWPLGLGLLLVATERLLGERRRLRSRTLRAARSPAQGRVVAATAMAAMFALTSKAALASPQSAERAFAAGDFAQAERDYASASQGAPADPRLDFNLGSAAYKAGDLDTAATSFERALRTSDLQLQERSYYNLGDALYRKGEAARKAATIGDTIKAWKQAIADYDAALHLTPGDADAKYNKELVEKKLAELQKHEDQKQDESKKDPSPPKSGATGKSQPEAGSGGKSPQPDKSPDGRGQPGKGGEGKGEPDKSTGEQGQPGKSEPSQPSDHGSPASAQPSAQSRQSGGEREPPASPRSEDDEGKDAPKPQGKIEPNGTSPGDDSADEAPSRPGELSRAEARALLDSLRGDLVVSARGDARRNRSHDDEPKKDW